MLKYVAGCAWTWRFSNEGESERGEFASKDKLDQSGRRSLLDGFNNLIESPSLLLSPRAVSSRTRTPS